MSGPARGARAGWSPPRERRLRVLRRAWHARLRALQQTRDQVVALRASLAQADAWGRRLEGELALQAGKHDAEREGCAQVFRDLRRQVRDLRGQLAVATEEAIALDSNRQHVIADLALERRERRRAVLFIADRGLLDVYADADGPPEILPMTGIGLTCSPASVDALAPTERPNALAARLGELVPPAIHDGRGRS